MMYSNIKKTFLFLLIFIASFSCFSIPQDSICKAILNQIKNEKTDSVKVELYNKLGYYFANVNPKDGIIYSQKAAEISKKIDFKNGLANAYWTIGINYYTQADYKTAIVYFNKALAATSNKKITSKVYRVLGLANSFQNNYPKALEYGLKSLTIAEEVKDSTGIATSLSNIGIVYADWKKYSEAINYYQQAIIINKRIKNDQNLSQNYGNIANVYSMQKNFSKAIIYYKNALQLCQKNQDIFNETITLGSIANCHLSNKNHDEALKFVENALNNSNKLGAAGLTAFLTCIKADVYFQKGVKENNKTLVQSSLTYFEKALAEHKNENSLKEIASDYDYIYKVHQFLNNDKQALDNYKLSIKYKDSVFNFENKESLKNIEDKHTIALKESKLKIITLTKERQKILFIAGILFLLVVIGFIIWQSRNRKIANKKLEIANSTKARFIGILNHDLRSPVANLLNYMKFLKNDSSILSENEKNVTEKNMIATAQNLLYSMEDILLWSKNQETNFEPQIEQITIEDVIEDLKTHFFDQNNIIEYNFSIDFVINTDANYLKTIMRNLIANGLKAVQNIDKPQIIVSAIQNETKKTISIKDNGNGIDNRVFKELFEENKIFSVHNGLGLHLVKDLAKAIKMKIELNSKNEKGTEIVLTAES